jgi:predicted flap endonuclease-1-like 5' DNA nuclease
MRLDYALYALAVIFFILSGVIAAYQAQQQQLWIVTTAVLGFVFIGLGYSQRPKQSLTTSPVAPPSTLMTQPTVAEVDKEEEAPAAEIATIQVEITKVKGIGTKRAIQLKALGINNAEDLAKASAKELATKLKISPKIAGKWILSAKETVKKT